MEQDLNFTVFSEDLALIDQVTQSFPSIHGWQVNIQHCRDLDELEVYLQTNTDRFVIMEKHFPGLCDTTEFLMCYPNASMLIMDSTEEPCMVTGSTLLQQKLNRYFFSLTFFQANQSQITEPNIDVVLDTMDTCVLLLNRDSQILKANREVVDVFGFELEELLGTHISCILPMMKKTKVRTFIERMTPLYGKELNHLTIDGTGRTKQGRELMVEVRMSSYAVGEEEQYMLFLRDISISKALEYQKDLQAAVINTIPEIVIFTDDELSITYTNPFAEEVLVGVAQHRDTTISLESFIPKNQSLFMTQEVLPRLKHGASWSGSILLKLYENDSVPVYVSIHALEDWYGQRLFSWILRDIHHESSTREHLRRLSEYDPLTGLYNRKAFISLLNQAVICAEENDAPVSLLMIGIDHFKSINDTYGYEIGDQLLGIVAERLKAISNSSATVARLGSDEFVILMSANQKTFDATDLANKIIQDMSVPYLVLDTPLYLTVSIGIATYPHCAKTGDELLRCADVALNTAKKEGRKRYCIYADTFHEVLTRKELIRNALNVALSENSFILMYQPIVNQDGFLEGFEALLRWENEWQVNTQECIDIAEQCGLISDIGNWVRDQAIFDLYKWRKDYGFDGYISINVSVKQLRYSEFTDNLLHAMEQLSLPIQKIRIELTESTLVEDTDRCQQSLEQLKKLRIPIYIDDFGSGYASFKHLSLLPVSALKIDKSFLDGIPHHEQTCTTVETIINLAHSMKLTIIAEGVETESQKQWLHQFGEDVLHQGYFYSRPMSVEDVQTLLIANPKGKPKFN
ncbi:putative bifunctional diguanylate cyclase/phosphodiesterase [Algicola sagamiensis]|uniref:putative bifunctional diguanylate cyclase/phosphodiesterase n=1 Tax=Algicola sagamiensis TaxID=163869 RepID=UPI00037B0133|nr:EAL domain-containing protein [Algicola sagamiensis]